MLLRCFTITNPSKEIIRLDVRHREDVRNAPVIIICHGFQGFKDWGFFPEVASRLADDGYIAMTFNFSRNGIGTDLNNITEWEKLSMNTYSHELKDLECVVDGVVKGDIGKGLINPDQMALLGYSRGGGIAILYANNDDRIKTLVTWSSISTIERFSQDEIKKWEKEGSITIENKRTKEKFIMKNDLLEDIKKNKAKLNIIKAAGNLDIPTLIIHGDEDEHVPVEEAHAIFNQLNTYSKDIEIIEGGTHTYGISHPMESISRQFDIVMDLTESWFDNHLNE
jgi:dienelactone hydrolase